MIQRKAPRHNNLLPSLHPLSNRHQLIVLVANRDVEPLRPATFRIVGEDEGTAGAFQHGGFGQLRRRARARRRPPGPTLGFRMSPPAAKGGVPEPSPWGEEELFGSVTHTLVLSDKAASSLSSSENSTSNEFGSVSVQISSPGLGAVAGQFQRSWVGGEQQLAFLIIGTLRGGGGDFAASAAFYDHLPASAELAGGAAAQGQAASGSSVEGYKGDFGGGRLGFDWSYRSCFGARPRVFRATAMKQKQGEEKQQAQNCRRANNKSAAVRARRIKYYRRLAILNRDSALPPGCEPGASAMEFGHMCWRTLSVAMGLVSGSKAKKWC